MRSILRTTAALALGMASNPLLAADLPRDFTASYGPAVKQMEQQYSHSTATGTIYREYPAEHRWYEQTFKYWAAGRNLRLDMTTRTKEENRDEVGSKDVYLATPDVSFMAHGGPQDPTIERLKPVSYERAKSLIEGTVRLGQSFSLGGKSTILDLLDEKQIKLEAMKQYKREGKSLVKITFGRAAGDANGSDKPRSAEHGYVVLSPSEGWGLREYSKTVGQGAQQITYRGTLGYTRDAQGKSVLNHMENWQERGPEKTCTMHEVISISQFQAGDPAPIKFTADGFQ